MKDREKRQKFTLISIFLFLLLSFPILSAANKISYQMHIPVLYVYLFMVWALAIILLFITAESKPSIKNKNE